MRVRYGLSDGYDKQQHYIEDHSGPSNKTHYVQEHTPARFNSKKHTSNCTCACD